MILSGPLTRQILQSIIPLFATIAMLAIGNPVHAANRLPGSLALSDNKLVHRVMVGAEDLTLDTRGNAMNFVALVEAEHDKGFGTSRCVGVAVARDVVLTAGHCLRDVHSVRVKFVSSQEPFDYETVVAKSTRMHPMTNGGNSGTMYSKFTEGQVSAYHDIGVILLEYPSIFAIPITAVPFDFDVSDVEEPHLFIFGRARDERHVDTGRIAFARLLPLAPFRGGTNYFRASLRSAHQDRQAACEGDSGGPVTVSAEGPSGRYVHYLAGIYVMSVRRVLPVNMDGALAEFKNESLIPKCGSAIAYVNIQSEIDWIESNLADMDPLNQRKLDVFGR